jgi:hypothetical protein
MHRAPTLALALLLAVPLAGHGQVYRFEQGLTGDASLRNPSARTQVLPLMKALDASIASFLAADPRDLAQLDDLLPQAEAILDRLPPGPPDDELTLKGFEAAGRAASLLESFGRRELALSLAGRIASGLGSLASAHPWNPVLASLAQGAALKRSLLLGGSSP